MDIARLNTLVTTLESAVAHHNASRDLEMKIAVGDLRRFVVEAASERDGADIGTVAGELMPVESGPSLDDVLRIARKHCHSMTLEFAGDDDPADRHGLARGEAP